MIVVAVYALMKSYKDALNRQNDAKNTLQDVQVMCNGMHWYICTVMH